MCACRGYFKQVPKHKNAKLSSPAPVPEQETTPDESSEEEEAEGERDARAFERALAQYRVVGGMRMRDTHRTLCVRAYAHHRHTEICTNSREIHAET